MSAWRVDQFHRYLHFVLEGMVELQEAAAWSISLIFMAAPALTGKTVGFWVPDLLKVL